MKIPAFLVTRAALALITETNDVSNIPLTWFNWSIRPPHTPLDRISTCESSELSVMHLWLAAVCEHDCAAILMLTSDDDPSCKYYGTDSEGDYQTVTIDMLDETDQRRLRREIAQPEARYLDQWARFSRGGRAPFRWLHATNSVWRAYADGLRAWAAETSARKLLEHLNAVDFTQISPDLELSPNDFELPEELPRSIPQDYYFPSIHNPAFAVGLRSGKLTTYGLCNTSNEWSFDKHYLIRGQLHKLTIAARSQRTKGANPTQIARLLSIISRTVETLIGESLPHTIVYAAGEPSYSSLESPNGLDLVNIVRTGAAASFSPKIYDPTVNYELWALTSLGIWVNCAFQTRTWVVHFAPDVPTTFILVVLGGDAQ